MCANSVPACESRGNGHLPGQRHVEQAAERVDVRARVAGAALDPLGRGVVERPGEVADLGDRRAAEALVARDRQPEVGHVGVIAGGDEHVAGLDVAVHEPERVRRVEGGRDLVEQPRGPRRRERDQHVQARPVDQLHREEQAPAALSRAVDGHDVGVADRRREP